MLIAIIVIVVLVAIVGFVVVGFNKLRTTTSAPRRHSVASTSSSPVAPT